MISRFVNKTLIKKDVYAVYNSYIIEPIFLNKKKAYELINNKLDSFTREEVEYLKQIGIIVKNKGIDDKIIDIIKDSYKQKIENRITLMYIIPTNACNLSCKYCFIGKLDEIPIMMSKETAKHAVDLFASHLKLINEVGEIFFYGGEPLINFELIKYIVNYCKEKNYNIKFSMVSNGLLLSKEKIDFIKNNNIALGISIDGPQNITDENRVYKSSVGSVYLDLMKKIEELKKTKVDFGFSITIAPYFLENQDSFLEWLKDLGVKNISYNLLHFTYKTDDWKNYYKKAVKFIYKSNNVLFNYGFNEDRINRKYKAFYNKEFKFSDCGAIGANQITICPDGNVEICHGYWNSNNHLLPNINELKDLSEIFNNKNYTMWKDYLTFNKKKCINCSSIYICGGGCAMQSEDLFGNKKRIDKAFCIYTKDMMKNILKEIYEDSII